MINAIVALRTEVLRRSLSGERQSLAHLTEGIYSPTGIPRVDPPLSLYQTNSAPFTENEFTYQLYNGDLRVGADPYGSEEEDVWIQLCSVTELACRAFNKKLTGDDTILLMDRPNGGNGTTYSQSYRSSGAITGTASTAYMEIPRRYEGCYDWQGFAYCIVVPTIER